MVFQVEPAYAVQLMQNVASRFPTLGFSAEIAAMMVSNDHRLRFFLSSTPAQIFSMDGVPSLSSSDEVRDFCASI